MTGSTLRIREITPGEFTLVWPIFKAGAAASPERSGTPGSASSTC